MSVKERKRAKAPRAESPKPRGEGVPFEGGESNPGSIPSRRKILDQMAVVVAAKEAAEARLQAIAEAAADRDDGVITAARMKKVIGQRPEEDSGPTERGLRKFMEKDYRAYLEDMAKFAERERVAGLEARAADETLPRDEGEERVAEAVRELLAKFKGAGS